MIPLVTYLSLTLTPLCLHTYTCYYQCFFFCDLQNPIINIRFYEKNADQVRTIAQPIADNCYSGFKPSTFEEFAVRVFCRYAKRSPKIEIVKTAFSDWCEVRRILLIAMAI